MSIFDNSSGGFVFWDIRDNAGIISLLLDFIGSSSGIDNKTIHHNLPHHGVIIQVTAQGPFGI